MRHDRESFGWTLWGVPLDTTHISQVISRSPAGCLVGPQSHFPCSRNGVFGWRLLRAFDRADFRSRLCCERQLGLRRGLRCACALPKWHSKWCRKSDERREREPVRRRAGFASPLRGWWSHRPCRGVRGDPRGHKGDAAGGTFRAPPRFSGSQVPRRFSSSTSWSTCSSWTSSLTALAGGFRGGRLGRWPPRRAHQLPGGRRTP